MPGKRLFRLHCISFAASVERSVFCMIENEILDPKLLCQPCGIEHRAMVLLVGLEALVVFIETESFTHQPVGTLCILTAQRTERLIAQTTEPLAVGEQCCEAELTLFGGMDVKALPVPSIVM